MHPHRRRGVSMRKLLLGVSCAIVCAVGIAAADRVPVTIRGCLLQGDKPNTYVITNVVEVRSPANDGIPRIYWLGSTKGLSDHVDHLVEVSGTVRPDKDAGKTAKIKIKP